MSHLDEGMLHELLDGELSADAARAARAHLVTCAECRALYEEAKEFFEESNRLVTALDLEGGLAEPPPSRLRRRLPFQTLAWAASIFLAISLGYYGSDFRRKTGQEATALADSAIPAPGNVESLPGVADARTAAPATAEAATAVLKERRQAQPAAPPPPVGRPVPMRTDQAATMQAESATPAKEDELRGQAGTAAANGGLAETSLMARDAVAPTAQATPPTNWRPHPPRPRSSAGSRWRRP